MAPQKRHRPFDDGQSEMSADDAEHANLWARLVAWKRLGAPLIFLRLVAILVPIYGIAHGSLDACEFFAGCESV